MPADKPNGQAQPAPETARPAIVLTFEGVGTAGFTISAVGVSPAQLYGAAFYLRELAAATWQGELRARAASGLVAAGPSVLDDLRRSGRV